jgi:hypothetical protein
MASTKQQVEDMLEFAEEGVTDSAAYLTAKVRMTEDGMNIRNIIATVLSAVRRR